MTASGEDVARGPEARPVWGTIRLPSSCANIECTNTPDQGAFCLAIEERTSDGPPLTLYVCSPCAAVLRGDLR